ncbi:MAG TPA: tRNA (N(6)-L-threonylcarbamoyladenosine(37)-C(2))-methylthiotransferase MtaB [Candidatus Latescibacteria bacterium]|nr:tRNA (N(6)-L-threonylcarbamoyladenosine(37)-C(2))-methylthiotransferase MtaB [Candidatus Latescibacterota bacterium]
MSTPPSNKTLRVALQNVGCKLNSYEVEALANGLDHRGYEIVPFGAQADVYVVNTCTVTGSGDADSRKAVRRAKRQNPAATVVATGCYAQRRPEELDDAGADLVIGNGQKAQLIEQLEAHLGGTTANSFSPQERPRTEQFLSIDGAVTQGRTRGMLQIQDGCDEHCTYCIIPSVRGHSSSRKAADIVAQARSMVEAGYRELALTGVHTGSYGYDQDDQHALVSLLTDISEIDGLARLRLNSIEPGYVDDALIEFAAASPIFCRHFHVPLQSGDDKILKRMGRHYNRAYYTERIERIATRIPDCAIGADVMVGFPGETEEQFAQTKNLLCDLPMTYLHVFPYSLRQGTAAEKLGEHLEKSAKKSRARELIALSEEKRLAFHKRFVSRRLQVLTEGRQDPGTGLQVGLSDNYIKALFTGTAENNRLIDVEVEQAREDLVFGASI